MKFCPSCEVKLKQGDFGLQCPKCNYVEGKETKQTKKSNAELGQEISIKATCDGSIPLKVIPSAVATKVASSTSVDIAEMIAFRSSEPLVFASKVKLIILSFMFQLNVMRNYAKCVYILNIYRIEL